MVKKNHFQGVLIGVISFNLGCGLTTFINQKVKATAPNIPPQLEKREFGYLLTWTTADQIYVSCYPGIVPKLKTTVKAWHSGVRILTCNNNN